MATKVNLDKHIWEGWTVSDFITELAPSIRAIMSNTSHQLAFKNKEELKKWCIENQPYYKRYIPEVVTYFAQIYNLKK